MLDKYARQLSEDSIAVYKERYRLRSKEPIIVEIFPNHEDFVVRSIGMPGVGLLGVTFGYLFAMDSPTAHPEQTYHWGTTLWHEMAHVFTLEVQRTWCRDGYQKASPFSKNGAPAPFRAVRFRRTSCKPWPRINSFTIAIWMMALCDPI